MSLTRDWPVVETGDFYSHLEAWRVTGASDSNTDGARLFASIEAGNIISLYKSRDRAPGDLVAQGTWGGTPGERVTLAEQNTSGLSATVVVQGGTEIATLTLYVGLCGHEDIREHDDRINQLLEEDPAESDFYAVIRQALAQFLVLVQERYPPPVRVGDRLRYPGTASMQEAGKFGLPEIHAVDLWALNSEGDWELVGLQNPTDYRQWAVYESLARIWRRRARSEEDPIMGRSRDYQAMADAEFERIPVVVDSDRDLLPEREVERRSVRWRRA